MVKLLLSAITARGKGILHVSGQVGQSLDHTLPAKVRHLV